MTYFSWMDSCTSANVKTICGKTTNRIALSTIMKLHTEVGCKKKKKRMKPKSLAKYIRYAGSYYLNLGDTFSTKIILQIIVLTTSLRTSILRQFSCKNPQINLIFQVNGISRPLLIFQIQDQMFRFMVRLSEKVLQGTEFPPVLDRSMCLFSDFWTPSHILSIFFLLHC